MTDVSDTRRRAELRGRESVARWRIESGVWSGRLFALIYAVVAILPLLSGGGNAFIWKMSATWLVVSAAILFATEQMKKGSEIGSCFLLALFLLVRAATWMLTGLPPWTGIFWTVMVGGGLANGVWGTIALASVRRDGASVPPAPSPPHRV